MQQNKDFLNCPYVGSPQLFQNEIINRCNFISEKAGFTVSVHCGICQECSKHADFENQVTLELLKRSLLSRIACGDDMTFFHSKAITADLSVSKVKALANNEEILNRLNFAVRKGHLSPKRAANIVENNKIPV